MTNIVATDPFDVLLFQQQLVGAPLEEGAAVGSDNLDVSQRSAKIGEVIPIVFARRRDDGTGGVLISPPATEARFENNASNEVTAYYQLVLSEGLLPPVQVRDIFQRSCRVGSFSQSFNRRAGSWLPGNFLVTQPGYTKPEATYFTGTSGTYENISTGSFVISGVPDGDTRWDRQVHIFIRSGILLIRILDSQVGPTDNIADVALYAIRGTSRVPESMIDMPSFALSAAFCEQYELRFNGVVNRSYNLESFLAETLPLFMLRKTKVNGKLAIVPSLPVDGTGAVSSGQVSYKWTFDEDWINPGSFNVRYIPLAERTPFCALMLWRQQPEDGIGLIRTTEVRYAGEALSGPFEQYDLSGFATSEIHAVRIGAAIISRRRHTTHRLSISTRPGQYNPTLAQGDIVRVVLNRTPATAAAGVHDYLYEVDRIEKLENGSINLDLLHFPINSAGQSLVALEFLAAQASGILLSAGKTGITCDANSSIDTTSVPDDSIGNLSGLPGNEAFEIQGDGLGGGFDPVDSGYGGDDGSSGDQGEEDVSDTEDPKDNQTPLEIGIPPEGAIPGATLTAPVFCESPTTQWFRDGQQIAGATGSGYTLGTIDVGRDITVRIVCLDEDPIETPPVTIPPVPSFGDNDSSQWTITFTNRQTTTGFASCAGGVFGDPITTDTPRSINYTGYSVTLEVGGSVYTAQCGPVNTTTAIPTGCWIVGRTVDGTATCLYSGQGSLTAGVNTYITSTTNQGTNTEAIVGFSATYSPPG